MAKGKHGRGSAADRLMRDALIVELQQDSEGPDGETVAKIRLVARALIDKAVAGEAAAIKEIFDRVDGRASAAPEAAATRGLTYEETLDLLD
jgi:hypothetical protein